MKIGDVLRSEVLKHDGTVYRRFRSTVTGVHDQGFTTVGRAGDIVNDIRGDWPIENDIRDHFRWGSPFIVLEVIDEGRLTEVYVNINSPIVFDGATIRWVDYELDAIRHPPGPAKLLDEDEFAEAAERYGYAAEFQDHIYRLADEALELANTWRFRGPIE